MVTNRFPTISWPVSFGRQSILTPSSTTTIMPRPRLYDTIMTNLDVLYVLRVVAYLIVITYSDMKAVVWYQSLVMWENGFMNTLSHIPMIAITPSLMPIIIKAYLLKVRILIPSDGKMVIWSPLSVEPITTITPSIPLPIPTTPAPTHSVASFPPMVCVNSVWFMLPLLSLATT